MASEIIDVTEVEVLHERVVRLTFETGEVREVDLEPLLWGPAFDPLADDALFRQVRVDPDSGTIAWPNGADISAYTLYQQSSPAGSQRAS
jgi:hypothetical protein